MSYISSYLEELSSQQTRRAYRTDLRRFFGAEDLEMSELKAIDSRSVQSFVRTMSREGRSMSTQRRCLAALRGFFDWLIRNGIVSVNPARHPNIEPLEPNGNSRSPSLLSVEDVKQMIKVAGQADRTGPRDRALILTIVFGALRRREVSMLEVEDVRPLGRYWVLDIDQAGSEEISYVQIPETVVQAIERMTDRYSITKGRLWRSLSNQNRGAPMTPDAIYKVVRRISQEAGVESASIDTLRRTGLRLALEGGADLLQIQTHGRFTSLASAAPLYNATDQPGALADSAVEYIELEIDEVCSDGEM